MSLEPDKPLERTLDERVRALESAVLYMLDRELAAKRREVFDGREAPDADDIAFAPTNLLIQALRGRR